MIGARHETFHHSLNAVNTVFLVDDDDAVRRYVGSLLKSVSLPYESYATAEDFLQAYEPDRPGCLVLDIRMPVLSGLDLQEMLADRGTFIPVIVVTAYPDVSIIVRSVKLGAVDVMEKPFNAQLLLERINEAFRLDSARRLQKAEQERILRCMAQLTPREREVMDLIVSGKSNKEIAYTLRISRKTYELHRARVMEKMQVTNAVELAQKAMRCTPWTRQKTAGNKVVNPA